MAFQSADPKCFLPLSDPALHSKLGGGSPLSQPMHNLG